MIALHIIFNGFHIPIYYTITRTMKKKTIHGTVRRTENKLNYYIYL